MANENFRVKNGLEVGGVLVVNSSGALVANIAVGTTVVNATAIGVGSNITINTSAISVGNSTVNAVLTQNSLDIDGTITSGNLNVTGHILPGANVTYDLGNSSMRWRDLYLSGSTIDLGGALLQTDANSGALAIIPKPTVADPNPVATVVSPQGGVVAVPTTGGVPAANAINEAATSNAAAPIPIDVTTTPPANSQILVWSASANVFLPTNTLLYLNALNSITVGANLIANTTALFIGNSTVNAVLTANSFDIDGTVAVGNTTITGDLTVSGNVFFNGGTTNVNSTNLVVEDKNIILGDTDTPTDVTADGGGITLKGTTDKTLTWVDSTDAWTASEDFNLVSGKQYEINGSQVINSTSLGTGITGSSLTSVGTLNGLSVSGTANATTSINVGANVNLSTSTINVGNSTVNTTVTSSVVTTSNVVATNLSGNGASVTSVDAATVGGNTASTLRTYSDTVGATAFSNAATRANDAYTNATSFAANADNIASGTLNTARLPATVNVSTAVNVGANVSINTSTIFIGNSTVNTTIQAGNINLQGTQLTVGNITISDSVFSLGNSTVNVFANSTVLRVGTNVVANSTALLVGNSTVNTLISSAGIDTDGTLAVLGTSQLTGNTTISGDLVVSGNVFFNGTTTNVNSTNLVVEDKNIIIGDVNTPTDVTADGGGITLKGTTDKTLNWIDSTDAWTSSEDFNLVSGKQYEINGVQVVNSTALGTGVTGSSLTSVGTLTGLTVSGAASLQNTLAAGNTTVTGFANISGNVYVGNSSVFWTANSTEIDVGNVTINTTAVGVGANLIVNTTALFIGNSTVNAAMRSTGLSVGSNVTVNTSAIQAGNSTANITIGSDVGGAGGNLYLKHSGTSYIYHGNSTVNATIASTQFVLKNNLTSAGATPAGDIDLFFGTADSPRIVLRRNNGDGTQRAPVAIVAGLGAGFDGVSTTDALRATSGINAGTTSLPNNPEFQANATLVYIGNSTVNTQITSTSIDTDGTLAVLGAATLSSTLAAGNTTVTGFVNVSSTANVGGNATLRGDVTVNGALTVSNTAALGNTTITGWANLTGNIAANNITARGNLTIDGDLTVSGNSVVISAVDLKITDNLIYLNEPEVKTITAASSNGTHFLYTTNNGYTVGMTVRVIGVDPSGYNVTDAIITSANSTTFAVANTGSPGAYVSGGTVEGRSAANPDLGFAGEYDDGTVKHAGFFRDATDSYFKVFDNLAPEPNGAFVDTANNTFRIANFQANNLLAATANVIGVLAAGNTTVTGFVNASVSVNSALITVGTSLIGNTTGLYHTGTVNAASVTVGASLVGNSSGLYHTGTVNAASHTTTGVTANTTGVFPASNSTGTALGAAANRWLLNANTINASGLITGTSGLDITGTANVSAAINVGANLTINTSTISIGNSTVNTFIQAGNIALRGTQLTVGNTTFDGDFLTVGNSTVNVFANSSTLRVGANVIANATALFIGNSTVNSVLTQSSLAIVGTVNATVSVNSAAFTVGTSFIANSSQTITPSGLVVRGGTAAGEGGQITIGYGNNLATAITGQANNTWNIDVVGGNTGSTPLLRVFAQSGDATIVAGFNVANTGRMHVGSLNEQTDSTFKVTGSANVTTSLQVGTSLIANGVTGTADQILYANSTGGVYWRTPATITNVEPSNVGATSNGHVWYVYV